ncbi:bifunctional diguanylate cyclase/phosphodiesterase [Paludibacterium denitrificans]|uniref:bifunctional diguanylate cyclase/phosphodiesterase n=1 Tax=Paludibacterium denitrificans TaxID=2675226 RepID=UPI0035E41852
MRSLLVAPLVLQHKAVGTLSLYSRQLGFFDDAKVELVKTMASEVGRSPERHDVMERNRKNESELAFLSHHDRLTGLPNRQLMEDHIARLISSESDSARLAVMVVSINNFHEVNARLGHEGGDVILCEVARRLRKEVYPFGYVGRVGASRFIACTDRFDQLDGLINQLMARLQSPVNCMGAVVETSSSVGVAVEFKNQAEARTLLRRADLALSRAKEKRGSQFRYYDEKMDEQIQRMHSLRSEFANALLRNELELFYQPKIDLHTREVVGAEALVRWYRDNRFVPPGEFFPAIEDTDLMRKLDWWVLREAIRHAQEWQGEGRVIPVSVNLSAMTLKHDSFVPGIEALMAAYPLPVGHLELEVLESVSQQEAEQVVAKLERCRELGLLIALDDFGTGASSLVHLQQLPFDTIKIDQRFVRRLLEAPGNEAIVRSMVSFAHYSDRKLVVEGVENQPIWARLLELGCTSGQGYGISPPMASRQLPGWIDGWETSDINLDYNI